MMLEQLSHYRILEPLGAGGMGVVYRARDERLGREVALKLLPAEFARDEDRLRRFEQEARATSALNHPNILTIYDIGTASSGDGAGPFIVMELLEGEELRAPLTAGPLAPRRAVEYARQIASGLAAAHAKGIVHRDLKPENLFLTTDGRVKILDFGLAKLRPARVPVESDAPTQKQITNPGAVLGTIGYMSPEQVRGQEVDHRSDIFSFGVILYELLAGQRPFGGASAVEAMNAILKEDPPEFDETNAKISPQLEKIVRRCLEKSPERRFQSASDLGFALEALTMPSGSRPEFMTEAPADPPVKQNEGRIHHTARFAWIVAGIAILALLTVLISRLRQTSPNEAAAVRFQIAMPEKAAGIGSPVISPDGRNLIFIAKAEGKRQIWLRPLGGFTAQPLPGTEEVNSIPFWSPDSNWIGFFAAEKLKKIGLTGGLAQTLCDVPRGSIGGSWGRDGTIIFYSRGFVQRVPATGGEPISTNTPVGGLPTNVIIRPYFLPDGRHFLHYATARQEAGIYLSSLDGKEPRRLLAADSDGIFAASSTQSPGRRWLLFLRAGSLLAQSFDTDRLTLTGEPFPLADQVEPGSFSVSDTGVLVYRPSHSYDNVQLGWIDRSGKPLELVGATGFAFVPTLSPDGKQVAVMRLGARPETSNIHVIDLAHNSESRLTLDLSLDGFPVWSPDGKRIVWQTNRARSWQLYQKSADGVGQEESLLQSDVNVSPSSWSVDGRCILYYKVDQKTLGDIWVLPLEGDRKPFPYLQTQAVEFDAHFSPDGRWVAYTSDESGKYEVYVQTFPTGGGKWKISTGAGQPPFPQWRRDGKELYYISADRKLMAVEVKPGATFEVGPPKALFDLAAAKVQRDSYTVSADGQRFLFPRYIRDDVPTPISVVINWPSEVKR